jgi:hypothetical protein
MTGYLLDSRYLYSLIRNFSIQLLFWIFFYPGFFSRDSFAIVEMAKTGNLSNEYTASWAIYSYLVTFNGNAIGLLSLFNGVLLSYSITRFTYAIFTQNIASFTSFLIILTPTASAMGITVWHDIPMTAGFFICAAFFTEFLKNDKHNPLVIFKDLVLISMLISFRPNGLPTIILFCIIYSIINRSNKLKKIIFVLIFLSIFMTLIPSYLILKQPPINNLYAQEWMRNDVSCFAFSFAGKSFFAQNPDLLNVKIWESEEACIFLNSANLSLEDLKNSTKFIPLTWIKIALEFPQFIFETHLKRNSYLLPFPIYGLQKVPFIHSTIEFKDKGIEWKFQNTAQFLRQYIRVWNGASLLFGWAGIWLLNLCMLYFIWRQNLFLPSIILATSLTTILFIFAPIPDARYALFIIIAGQIATLGNLAKWALSGSNRRPTD